ncbi:LOW QUALITY PROTEIN: hypothetical protein CVT26_008689 [Gymnopilus dilepis]|uniref:Uncharacterized protein n=1 Tax=Gymnopilus dilepis TaxID=231916 RepID=A0A409XY15_9AGAR|nr:LOW QUALITY PROTEIN: hypothetical protein CVT26_008689 [Gymnopilus dilepis]
MSPNHYARLGWLGRAGQNGLSDIILSNPERPGQFRSRNCPTSLPKKGRKDSAVPALLRYLRRRVRLLAFGFYEARQYIQKFVISLSDVCNASVNHVQPGSASKRIIGFERRTTIDKEGGRQYVTSVRHRNIYTQNFDGENLSRRILRCLT